MGYLAKRKTRRLMDSDGVVTTLTPDQIVGLAKSLADDFDRNAERSLLGRFVKDRVPRAFVDVGTHGLEWSPTEYHTRKDKVTACGFTIQVSWGEADPAGRRQVLIHTSEALLLGDTILWFDEHEKTRRDFLSGMRTLDPTLTQFKRAGEE